MNELSLEERKKIVVEVLDDFVSVCERNGIDYYLAYGTLLGAIRHNGFIPWDDDVDVWVPIDQYEKCLAALEKESAYKVINQLTTENYLHPFSKLAHRETQFIDEQGTRLDWGVYIDIFPLVGTDDIKQVKKCCNYNKMRYRMICYENKTLGRSFKDLVKKSMCLCARITGRSSAYYRNKINKFIFTMKPKTKFGSPVSPYGVRDSFFIADFEKKYKDFEGKQYVIPAGYDNVLTSLYGDYMTPPPKEKQVSNHKEKVIYVSKEGEDL